MCLFNVAVNDSANCQLRSRRLENIITINITQQRLFSPFFFAALLVDLIDAFIFIVPLLFMAEYFCCCRSVRLFFFFFFPILISLCRLCFWLLRIYFLSSFEYVFILIALRTTKRGYVLFDAWFGDKCSYIFTQKVILEQENRVLFDTRTGDNCLYMITQKAILEQ